MAEHEDRLLLKWGTLKGFSFEGNEAASALVKEYFDMGASVSAMAQRDTPRQVEILCELIAACRGPIYNDWTGERMTKEEATDYVRSYRR